MAIDFPNSPAPGTNFTVDGKTWTFTDGKWALNVSVGGVQGPAGVAIQGTAPATTDVLWADTSDTGLVIVPAGGTTGQVLAKSSSADYATAWATPVTSGDMALKANLESPTFTGTPTLPTGTIATTQTAGNSSTAIATTAFVGTAVANLVDSAPATLNTLDELALALGDDANFATTTATAIGLKAPLASPALTGTPTAPTASAGTNTTQIATTEFANTAGGLVLLASGSTPGGSTSFSFTGFTSTYTHYLVKVSVGYISNDCDLYLRYNTSGGPDSGANYFSATLGFNDGGGAANSNQGGATFQTVGPLDSSQPFGHRSVTMEIFSPLEATRTEMTYSSWGYTQTGTGTFLSGGGCYNIGTSHTGFTMFSSNGTSILGATYQVYGYRK